MKIPIFPGKYHQNGGFSMAMLVYRSVLIGEKLWVKEGFFSVISKMQVSPRSSCASS